ncbi:CD48 antigen [Pempheris klunzingeri]|uniref:CD48 antigen n=1 Tax=Pempheris klunzingeri TaxID=3127111 RepID=UPI0039819221
MKLPLVVVLLIIQVALVESLKEVCGYLGDNVTLPSGADPSWNLTTIEWSIFSNDTWIATYRGEKLSVNRVSRYEGRLSLNIITGDLTIHNLNAGDAREYTVDLSPKKHDTVNKIMLRVRQRLQKPTTKIITSTATKEGCWLGLQCSSADKDVEFSWQIDTPNVTAFNMWDSNGRSSALLAFLNTTQKHVRFTCTTSNNRDNASSVITPKCDDGEHPPQPEPLPFPQPILHRNRYAFIFITGGFFGCSLTMIFIHSFLR